MLISAFDAKFAHIKCKASKKLSSHECLHKAALKKLLQRTGFMKFYVSSASKTQLFWRLRFMCAYWKRTANFGLIKNLQKHFYYVLFKDNCGKLKKSPKILPNHRLNSIKLFLRQKESKKSLKRMAKRAQRNHSSWTATGP